MATKNLTKLVGKTVTSKDGYTELAALKKLRERLQKGKKTPKEELREDHR